VQGEEGEGKVIEEVNLIIIQYIHNGEIPLKNEYAQKMKEWKIKQILLGGS
jgi:hypothetical protein